MKKLSLASLLAISPDIGLVRFKRVYLLQHNNGDPIRVSKVPGRNDPCICNSGRKYKSCCLNRPPLKIEASETMAEKVENQLQDKLSQSTKPGLEDSVG